MLANNYPVGYGQPLSSSLPTCLGCEEGIEYPVLDFFRNTSPAVDNPNMNVIVKLTCANGTLTHFTIFGEFFNSMSNINKIEKKTIN